MKNTLYKINFKNVKVSYNKKDKKDSNNIILSSAAYISLITLTLQVLLYAIFDNNPIVHYIVLGIAAVPTFLSLYVWVKINSSLPILMYSGTVLIYIVQYILFAENREVMNDYILQFFLMCLPAFINMTLVDDGNIEKRILEKFSIIIFALSEIYFVLILLGFAYWKKHFYSMSLSYFMLLPTLYFTYLSFKNRRVKYMALAFLSVINIFFLGSRGPLLCWIIFFAFCLIFSTRKSTKILSLLLVILFACSFSYILEIFSYMLSGFSINSRSFQYILSGQLLSNYSGRDILFDTIISLILRNPILGNGLGADIIATGQYTHNLILDLLLHYGIIVGSIFLLTICFMIMLSLLYEKDRLYWLVFFCSGFVPIMFSSTYLRFVLLWIFLGYCARIIPVRLILSRY